MVTVWLLWVAAMLNATAKAGDLCLHVVDRTFLIQWQSCIFMHHLNLLHASWGHWSDSSLILGLKGVRRMEGYDFKLLYVLTIFRVTETRKQKTFNTILKVATVTRVTSTDNVESKRRWSVTPTWDGVDGQVKVSNTSLLLLLTSLKKGENGPL